MTFWVYVVFSAILEYKSIMYKSCNLILHGLCFYPNELVSCCYSPNEQVNGGLAPILFDKYNGEIIQINELFSRMRKYSEIFKNGNCPVECKNCFQIKEKDWDESQYIDFITITHYSCCNADCIYCSNNLEKEERTNDKYEVMPFLLYLKKEGILKDDLELHLGGGEITIYKECEAILEEFGIKGNARIHAATNAVKYSENLAKAIAKGNTNVIVSLDCGTKETFKKIKRIDAFDKVIENIYKYSQAKPHKVTLKYILIPGVNDNMNEFKKFIDIVRNAKISTVRLDIEGRYLRSVNNDINPYYFDLAEKMKNYAEKFDGYVFQYHEFIKQSITKGIKKKNIRNTIEYIKLKFLNSAIKELYTSHKY